MDYKNYEKWISKEELEKQVNQWTTKEQVIKRAIKRKQKELRNIKQYNLGLDHFNYTEKDYTDAMNKFDAENHALAELRQNKIRIAKRMAYEELVKDIPDLETRESLLKKDDRHVEQVLKQFGIKIDFGKTIIV